MKEPRNQFKSSVFRNADPSNVGRSLLEGSKDHLLNQAKYELTRQKTYLSTISSVNYSNMLVLKDWNYKMHKTDTLNLDENKFVYKKNFLLKEKVLRDTQIRSMHEMGEMKKAQELRVDEVSVQKN